MTNPNLPYLQVGQSGNGLVAVENAGNGIFFSYSNSSNSYSPEFFNQDSLVSDGQGGYKLTQSDGTVLDFYGLDVNGVLTGLPKAQQGQLRSYTDANGNLTTTTYTSGQLTSIQRTDGTTTESYNYTYTSIPGISNGLVSNIALQRGPAGGALSTVQQVAFKYYDGTIPYGNPGDLETETLEDANGNAISTTYYRYYTTAEVQGGAPGYVGGLEYQFNPQSYARLVAALGDPTNPANASAVTNAAVAKYADQSYQYDQYQRVTGTTVQGSGCSCTGSTGQGTYTYSYAASPSNPSSTDYNTWTTKTTETLPDGNKNIVYTNFAGEVILSAFDDVSDPANPALNGLVWATYYQYDSAGRLTMTAQPSAVTITSLSALTSAESHNDLVAVATSSGNGDTFSYAYLSPNSGIIELTDYGTATTATATTAGDVLGYRRDDKIENGYQGAPILQDSTNYISHTDVNGVAIYPVASSTVYRNTDGTGAEVITDSYTWYSGTNQVQSETVNKPVISATENGPGTADVVTTVYDTSGRPVWTRNGDGFIDYTAYDNATGAVVTSITDVDTTKTSEFTGLPAGWSTPAGGGLNLVTSTVVDGLGRPTKVTDPNGNITYYVYNDTNHEVRTYAGWNSATGAPTLPTEIYREDWAHNYVETLTTTQAPNLTNGVPNGTEVISNTNGAIQSLRRTLLDNSNRPIETDQYFNLAGLTYSQSTAQLGTAGTNYYATTYGYDEQGLQSTVTNPNGTITITTYDGLGRAFDTYIGTNDTNFWASGGPQAPSNMTLVRQNQYDNNGVGDGNLTMTVEYPDASAADERATLYAYDWRDRLVATKSGAALQSGTPSPSSEDTTTNRSIVFYDLDNLGEITAVSVYDGDGVALTTTKPGASLLKAYETYAYDDQGRVDQTARYDVNQTTGAYSAALVTSTYYDHRGNVIAVYAPGGQVTKDQYDGAGRLVSEAITDGAGGTSWADADSLIGDHVLTETLTSYDANGNPILVTTKDRFNTDTSSDTGPLGNVTTGPQARVSYVANYFDSADRLTASVNVGTNGGAAYTRPATPPASSSIALVTSEQYQYGTNRLVQTETDPNGIQTQTTYDLLGRAIQVIDAYNPGINGGLPTSSANQTTDTTYDGLGDVTSVTAVMPSGTPNQTTAYIYGVTTAGGSELDSNDLLATLEYPDPTTGQPSSAASNQRKYTYNALGEPIVVLDPNGTVHGYTYNSLGRLVDDTVTNFAAGVDSSVARLAYTYDTLGNELTLTSENSAGTPLNQVENVYNGLGQLITQYQEQNGAVNTATSPKVQFTYNEMANGENNSRLTSMTYPNGRVLDYVYNPGLDDAISRVSALADDNNGVPGTILESYAYLGLDTIVARNHPQTGINLTYLQQPGDSQANTDGGDQYTGLDRFGRVIDQNWVNSSTGQSVDRFQYTYDQNGNVLSRADLVDTALSQLYSYDSLNRLTGYSQGTLSNGAIANPTTSQTWTLDALGNWANVSTTTGGTTTSTAQTFNTQNQATSVSGGTAPTFDANGNTTSDSGDTYVYDAWNRLTAVKNSAGTTIATYSYDALGRRITESYPGSGTTNHLYYSPNWQVIEERQNGTAASDVSQQYVWSQAGIDTMVLRDSYSGGVATTRLYALQDANNNTTAVVNNSGTVQERYTYDSYGHVTILNASGIPVQGNASSVGWQYLFQGMRLDQVSGWYGQRFRDYIPEEGRWAERDPLGFEGGQLDFYVFVADNPINSIDPSGEGVEYSGGRRGGVKLNKDGSIKDLGKQYEEITDAQRKARKCGKDPIRETKKSKQDDAKELEDMADEALKKLKRGGTSSSYTVVIIGGAGLIIGGIALGAGTIVEDFLTGGAGILDDPASFGAAGAMMGGGAKMLLGN